MGQTEGPPLPNPQRAGVALVDGGAAIAHWKWQGRILIARGRGAGNRRQFPRGDGNSAIPRGGNSYGKGGGDCARSTEERRVIAGKA